MPKTEYQPLPITAREYYVTANGRIGTCLGNGTPVELGVHADQVVKVNRPGRWPVTTAQAVYLEICRLEMNMNGSNRDEDQQTDEINH